MSMSLDTPILLIIFNRPETTNRVFEVIRKKAPKRLFIAADGPRADKPEDVEKCAATRDIINQVDWDCELREKFSDDNLGCGQGPASAISWVFENADEAIILEDDCLPDSSFFPFCSELLRKYRDDKRVMQISGSNYSFRKVPDRYSYHFSRAFRCHGWATWRSAWKHFDFDMKLWPEIDEKKLFVSLLENEAALKKWSQHTERVYKFNKKHVWDRQWVFACMAQSGLSAVSNTNLISNIGFNSKATHTTNPDSPFAAVPLKTAKFPLRHPPYVVDDTRNEDVLKQMLKVPLSVRLIRKAGKMLRIKRDD